MAKTEIPNNLRKVYQRFQRRRMALFFTGRRRAGENLARVLAPRAAGLALPIQMSDALSRNFPKLPKPLEITPAFLRRTSRPSPYRSAPCGNTPPVGVGGSLCRSKKSAQALPSGRGGSNCWRPRAVARSTSYWCGGWIAGAGR